MDGPNEADSWLDLVSDELINLRVPIHFRVSIAAGRLSGRARRWWRDTKALHGGDDISWTEFRNLFLDEYVSGAHREEKCKELDRLQQGDMTVQEYREKFEELCVYKEYFRTHPKEKMNKFIDGLKGSYQTHLSVHEHTSYKALVEATLRLDSRARHIEPLLRDQPTNNQTQKRSYDSQITDNPSQARTPSSHKRFRPFDRRPPKPSQDVTSPPGIVCYYCEELGHKKPNCPKFLRDRESRGTGRGDGGGNTYVSGDRGGNRSHQTRERGYGNQPAQSHVSHNKAQASSQPGRVYALTRDTYESTDREGNFEF